MNLIAKKISPENVRPKKTKIRPSQEKVPQQKPQDNLRMRRKKVPHPAMKL